MKKAISIENRARKVIMDMMDNMEEINIEGVMEMIEPHVTYDVAELERQARRRLAGGIIRKKKDDDGVRDFFSCKNNEGSTTYVNIEKTQNSEDLEKIDASINKQYLGLARTKKKISRRRIELMGQISLDEVN